MTSTNSATSQMVIEHYSALACEDASNNAAHIKKVAESFGYDPEDLAAIPEGANLGLSCGNPLVIAGLKPVCSLAFNVHLRSAHHVPSLRGPVKLCGQGRVTWLTHF